MVPVESEIHILVICCFITPSQFSKWVIFSQILFFSQNEHFFLLKSADHPSIWEKNANFEREKIQILEKMSNIFSWFFCHCLNFSECGELQNCPFSNFSSWKKICTSCNWSTRILNSHIRQKTSLTWFLSFWSRKSGASLLFYFFLSLIIEISAKMRNFV